MVADLKYNLRWKLDDDSASVMWNRHLISNNKIRHSISNVFPSANMRCHENMWFPYFWLITSSMRSANGWRTYICNCVIIQHGIEWHKYGHNPYWVVGKLQSVKQMKCVSRGTGHMVLACMLFFDAIVNKTNVGNIASSFLRKHVVLYINIYICI